MKRTVLFVLSIMLILSGCGAGGSSSSAGPATTETEGKVYNVKFGEVFHYHRTNSMNNYTSKIALTLSNPEVVDYRVEDDTNNDKVDYIKLFMQVENVGDKNSMDAVSRSNFDAYDSNGKKISTFSVWVDNIEGEFQGSELRPGGKNEGYIYIPIEEDSVPTEIIFFDSLIRGAHTNQFVIKL